MEARLSSWIYWDIADVSVLQIRLLASDGRARRHSPILLAMGGCRACKQNVCILMGEPYMVITGQLIDPSSWDRM